MKCNLCDEIYETPIFFKTIMSVFNMDAAKVRRVYHKKGHKIFD